MSEPGVPSHPPLDLAVVAPALARRFIAGATMWCASPQWPAHGRHVAAEFTSPVVTGRQAFPAVPVEDPDVVVALRLLARPGDIVLAIGSADDDRVGALLRRSEAWGLTSVWLGAGPRPPAGAADHVIWLDGSDAAIAARSGELTLRCRQLCELTHAAFEQPGLLENEQPCTDEVCVTCSDEGRLAEVAAVHGGGSAEVMAAGRRETIDITLVDPVQPGDLVLVHAGVAISVIEEPAR